MIRNTVEYAIYKYSNLSAAKKAGSIKKISEISEMVGYTNAYSFTRIFKKSTGVTPGEYLSHIATGNVDKVDE